MDVPTTIDELLRRAASAAPHVEVAFPDEACTYAELDRRADAFASLCLSAGLEPGDRVALWLAPSLDLLAVLFGCVRAGGVIVPVSDRFRPVELAGVLATADPKLVVTGPADAYIDRPQVLREVAAQAGGEHTRLIVITDCPAADGFTAWPSSVSTSGGVAVPTDAGTERDLALMLLTSGTSAAPKACMLSHRGLLTQAGALATQSYLIDAESVVWTPLPLFHIAGIVSMLAAIRQGASFVHSGVFDSASTLRLVGQRHVTHALAAFDTIWMRLLDDPAYRGDEFDSIRVALSASGAEQLHMLHTHLPHVAFLGNYGSTEGCGHVVMARADEPLALRADASGLPLDGYEVRIVDIETGAPAQPGEIGEIHFRGPARFVGYFRDEAANGAIDADGWFHSGDLGVMSASGRLRFAGRLKDMLKVGGENVAAAEVESYLSTHPAVSIVAVVGAADDYYGEVPVAFVELMRDATATEAELRDYCIGQIATYKVPRYVRFVTEWPMSGTKIRKNVLREAIASELAGAGITEAPRIRVPKPQHPISR